MAASNSGGGWNEIGETMEPVSPTGQYFNSSVLSVSILSIFESEIPIDDSPTMTMLTHTFLPINPRFSSIMVKDEHGLQRWKRVKVRLEDHVHIPVFPADLPPESYDAYFQEYLSKIAMEHFSQSRPLWDIHIIKYPLKNAAGALVIRLHHSMGDGFSLMGALFSCVKRADDPSKTLTFPSSQSRPSQVLDGVGICRKLPKFLSTLYNTASDFAFSLLKSNLVEDSKTAVRSGIEGVEFLPMAISTVSFSLEQIKQVKSKLGGTINDVICGIVFYGIRLYTQSSARNSDHDDDAHMTALVLLNTRIIGQYQSIKEMTDPDAESPWGNQFGFLHVSVPPRSKKKGQDQALEFVFKAKEIIQRKRSSLAVYLTGKTLQLITKIKGPEATAQYIHSTLRNTSMTISNMIGPMEQMSIADHPIQGLYFMVVGSPQSLTITMVSYRGELRMAFGSEKGYINSQLLISCMERAFDGIFEAATSLPPTMPT